MTAKKWFSENDVNAARERLSALPDLTRERLTRAEVLGQLRDDIRTLHRKKGYTLPELRQQLESVGLTVSEKTLRDLLDGGRPARRRKTVRLLQKKKRRAVWQVESQINDRKKGRPLRPFFMISF